MLQDATMPMDTIMPITAMAARRAFLRTAFLRTTGVGLGAAALALLEQRRGVASVIDAAAAGK